MASLSTAPHERIAELERLLEQRTAELNEAKRELEGFAYSVSHDLRAPLRHILGYTQILAEDCAAELRPESRQYVATLQEGARKLSRMLDELLKLSRISRQPLAPAPVSLTEVVRSMTGDLDRENAQRKIQWKIGHLPVIECDPALTRQLFQHLLENAVKFTARQVEAVIEIGTIEQNGPVFFVRDNGVGFDMKYADKLFGLFQRLHSQQEFEGLGSGLALAQRIVRRHGGRIWAEAASGHGATFYFTLHEDSFSGDKP